MYIHRQTSSCQNSPEARLGPRDPAHATKGTIPAIARYGDHGPDVESAGSMTVDLEDA